MLIRFLKNTELNNRIYLAGESYEMSVEQAAELIANGSATKAPAAYVDPEPVKVKKPK